MIINKSIEAKLIKTIMLELGLDVVYFNDLIDADGNEILSVELETSYNQPLIFNVNDIPITMGEVSHLVITMVYLRLQEMERKFLLNIK